MSNESNLYRALKETVIEPEIKFMSELSDSDYAFSRKYQRRMKSIAGMNKITHHSGIKFRFKVAASLIAAAITIGSVGAIAGNDKRSWEIQKNESIDTVQGSIDFTFTVGEVMGDEVVNIGQIHEPTYIPDGFELDEETSKEFDAFYYSNGDKRFIFDNVGLTAVVSIDNERLIREKVDIRGYEADLFSEPGEDSVIILWCEGPNVFELIADLEKSEAIKVAESIQPV